MIRRLAVTRDAETDVTLLWVYYAEKSERTANRVRNEISSNYSLLLQFPYLGRNREELRKGLRSFAVGMHVVFYRELADGIEIVRVLHGAQDVLSAFPPEEEEPSDK